MANTEESVPEFRNRIDPGYARANCGVCLLTSLQMNSKEYWSHRFIENWEERGGRRQSRAFAELALRNLPSWLISTVRSRRLSVLDWGCALGDGTDLLASALCTDLTGMDFAEAAMASAKQTYGTCEFLCCDLTVDEVSRKWDVVFSSNTLEHLRNPWEMLQILETHARSSIVVLVPFLEIERYEEHAYTFLNENIPTVVGKMHLAHAVAVDASTEPATMWSGHQILLVYVASDFAKELALSLSDLTWIGRDQHNPVLSKLAVELETLLATLAHERQVVGAALEHTSIMLAEEQAKSAAARTELEAQKIHSTSVDLLRNQWQYRAESIERSTSWRLTAPLRKASAAIRLAADARGHIKRVKWVVQLRREHGWLAALLWTYRRARHGGIGRSSAKSPAFQLIKQPFNPYSLIEPLKPIPVDVIDGQHEGEVPAFSCVVTVLNESASIATFLHSLAAQSACPTELILVDGGSSDDTVAVVRRWAGTSIFPVRLIEAGRVNIAQGRNIGAGLASTDIILFADAGTILLPDFCRNMTGGFADWPNLDATCGLYRAEQDNKYSRAFIWDWASSDHDWDQFLPSARALAVRTWTFERSGGFPEYLTKTGEDTLFAIRLRQVSRRWAVCRAAIVVWKAPVTAAERDRLTYSYASGDGESGVGDFRAYPVMIAGASSDYLPAKWIEGFRAGRSQRPALEYHRRNIRKLIVLLSGVPFTDSGGGQRSSQIAMAFVRHNCKVVFVNIYPSFEERRKIYFDTDLTLFEFYTLRDFNPQDLYERYKPLADLEVLVISEFPHPALIPVIDALKRDFQDRATTVYDYIDNWRTSLGWDWYKADVEARFVAESDVLVASARTLRDQLQQMSGRKPEFIPNAVNDRLFDRGAMWDRPADLPWEGEIVTYIGAMWGDWFDWQLLESCARTLPEVQFVLIGGVDPVRCEEIIGRHANIHFLGLKPQRDLPAYLASSTAAIIPFEPGDVTTFVNPLKVYEYVAMGIPVVASNMPEIAGIPGVTVTDSSEQFGKAVSEALRTPPPVDDMMLFTKSNNWDNRVDAFLNLLRLPLLESLSDVGGSLEHDEKRHWQGVIDPARNSVASVEAVLDLYRSGKLHEPEFALFRAFDRPDDLILDIGANTGQSIASIRLVAPATRIVAFEPNNLLRPTLERVAAELGNVETIPCGLGDRDTSLQLFTPVMDGLLFTPLSSLDIATLQTPSQLQYMRSLARDGRVALFRSEATIRVGDTFNLRPTAIKIDVEGFEMQVIAGLQETLGACRPLLLIEKSRVLSQVVKILSSLGYRPMKLVKNASSLQSLDLHSAEGIPLNIPFVHREKYQDAAERGIAIID